MKDFIPDKKYGKPKLNSVSYIRLLGTLTITICLSYHQVIGCIRFEDLSTKDDVGMTIEIKSGDEFNVTCCLQNHSSCLHFTEENNYISPYQEIQILNDSAIFLRNRKAEEGRFVFVCACDNKGVQRTLVFVGSTPKGVKSLECIVFDFLSMECTIHPYNETLYTQYDITEMKRRYNQYDVVFEIADSQYKSDQQFYTLAISSSNSLGDLIEYKTIDQYSIVKPQLPDVKIVNITTNGVTLSWNKYNYATYNNYTNGLVYEISLKADNFDLIKIDLEIKSYHYHFWVEIPNLHSYIEYTVHLRVKANKSIDKETMWSERFIESFTTLSRPPTKAPEIDVGSFSIHSEEKYVSLFWRQLPECERNGPNLTYNIVVIKENGQIINPTLLMDKTSASVYIEWKYTSKYEFELKSQNEVGLSVNSSSLKINPRQSNISHEEQMKAITKLYHKTNRTYTISWLKPINFTVLSSFTLFWCSGNTELKNQCNGPIHFRNLDKNALYYNTDQINTSLNFALSENYYNSDYSSGMMWAMCALDADTELFLITLDKVTKRTENSITFQWIKKCWYAIYIDEYILTYCEDNSENCEEKSIPKDSNNYEIIGLKPSSLYQITIRTLSKTKLGPISDPVLEASTTNEHGMTKLISVTCSSIMALTTIIVVVFYLKKQYRKMMKIGVILPIFNKEDGDIIQTVNDNSTSNLNQNPLYKTNNYQTIASSDQSLTACNVSCESIVTKEKNTNSSVSIEENDNYSKISTCFQRLNSSHIGYETYSPPQTLSSGYVTPQHASIIFSQLRKITNTPNKHSSSSVNGEEHHSPLQFYNSEAGQTKIDTTKTQNFSGYIY